MHRPVYTPRTGFVWPIIEASTSDDPNKKREQGQEPSNTQDNEDISRSDSKRKTLLTHGDVQRQQNSMLLYNAMRTTAAHSSASFSLPTAPSEPSMADTPAAASAARASATPAPALPRGGTPRAASTAPTPQEAVPVKNPPGAGKKKKKRTSSLFYDIPASKQAPPTGTMTMNTVT